MRYRIAPWVVAATILTAGHISAGGQTAGRGATTQSGGRGTIKGHVRLSGELPGNPVIRMGRDPMCASINRGKQVVQETVVASLKGDLANVFVKLQGSFPPSPAPAAPVTIDQRACIYSPRVVGVQVGQTLAVRNSDPLLHNVHSSTPIKENSFNIGQPMAGMMNQFRLKEEPGMLRLMCDIHTWMTGYIGVVSHPYFAVTSKAGTFEIANVPPGTYTIEAWHERYGAVKRPVTVRAGTAATVDFTYTGKEKPPA
jgi:plastocyanin